MVERKERKHSYDYDDLISSGNGKLFEADSARLPLPPMLMFDDISHIDKTGGAYGLGQVRANFAIEPDHWFFKCHFHEDPVMPGCLGLDALWQLLGFFLCWSGSPGRGRALGVGEVKFTGQIMPDNKEVTYGIDIKRLVKGRLVLGLADGWTNVDGQTIYKAKDLKVGLFTKADSE